MTESNACQRSVEMFEEEEDWEEDISEIGDHVSGHSESDSEEEEGDEDESDREPAPKQARLQTALGSPSTAGHTASMSAHQQPASGEIWMSKNGAIEWSPFPKSVSPLRAANVMKVQGGPTRMAVTQVQDIESSFELFLPDDIQNIILDCSNLEGRCVFGEGWKDMDHTHLCAYVGLLILAGVFRSKGESTDSLWDAETGRELFRATMSLKHFHIISRILRFDNRDDRPARRQRDELAAIRTVWDKWVHRLSLFYNPGPDVSVDLQLVPCGSRCPFKQRIPSKPGKYGIKIWAACDAMSWYAWNLLVCTGKPEKKGAPEQTERGVRAVRDLTQGLSGRNITCGSSFTSHRLGQELLKRKLTMVGAVRRSEPELPPQLLSAKSRPVNSCEFGFTADTSLVSYVPKRGKHVVIMSTSHRDSHGTLCGREHRQPQMVMDYNATKGGVENMDKLVTGYSCKMKTLRWPLLMFFNILDISAFNAFVVWTALNPEWNKGKLQRRRLFLEELGKALVRPQIQRRQHFPRSLASAAIMRRIKEEEAGAPTARPTAASSGNKRKRCEMCGPKMDRKTQHTCSTCNIYICNTHTVKLCHICAA